VGAAAAAAALAGRSRTADAEPPPETTRLTLLQTASLCQAPQYVAEDLLRGEGFTDVRYIKKDGQRAIADALASGEANINMHFSGPLILRLDAGAPITILAGVHPGCYELFATERVRTVSDLKGKTVGIRGLEGPEHVFLASMLAYVGLDPRKDVTWVTHSTDTSIALLAEGKIDAFMGFPPDPRRSARGRSATWSSTAIWTVPGLSTSAASWRRTASSCRSIPSRPNAPCVPS